MVSRRLCAAWLRGLTLLALAGCGGSPQSALRPSPPAALPTLRVVTDRSQAITSREEYVAGTYSLEDGTGTPLLSGGLEIRGRGNTTWELPKKPYRVRLAKSTSLLGMPADRHWVLLANYSDKTLIRNAVALEFSRQLGSEYAVRSQFVELHLNGGYQGVYQLAEHIRVAPERVNIPEIEEGESDPERLTGGYLIEVDARYGEDFCFASARSGMVFCPKSPEGLEEPEYRAAREYITSYLEQLESALFSEEFMDPVSGYTAYLDIDSAVRYYLLHELFKNVDGDLKLSTYLVKKRGGKLAFGPDWDFDIALGNVNYGGADSPMGWHIRNAPWFARLFEDPAFEARVKARWQELKAAGAFDALLASIDAQSYALSKAQARNFQLWDILSVYVWPNRVVTGSYEGEVAAMKSWLRLRIAWMDERLRQ